MSAINKILSQLFGLATYLIFLTGAGALAESIEYDYSFESPQVHSIKIDDQIFDRVVLPGSPNSGQIGSPALPSFGARILLPYGTDIEKIEVNCGEKIFVGSEYLIEPVEKPFVLSSSPDDIEQLYLNLAIYASKAPYPSRRSEQMGIQVFRGYRILILKLNPVEYVPASGELYYFEKMSVKINLRPFDKSFSILRNVLRDEEEIIELVDNSSTVSTYGSADKRGGKGYDMLIVTTSSLSDAFLPLKEYHDTTGVATEIHTISDIGASDPHSIRDYIRNEYLNNGVEYVLIGGDDDLIPALDMYVVTWEGDGALTEYTMPGDFYFSCLDGTFNYDGDDLWGEPGDGEAGGELDLFGEVHIGRFGVNTVQEVNNLVSKTLSYASSGSRYLQKVLLAGEQLRFGALGEYGGYAMDEMVNFSDAHGLLTFGFPETEYEIEKLYDLLVQPYNYWPASEMISRMNSGVHIIDHLGHSGQQYAMRIDVNTLVQNLTNTEYFFVYAEGCSAGTFDVTDCWAEYVTTKLSTGGFACIANARLGLGSRSTAHPVHIFNRLFWDAIHNGDGGNSRIGRGMSGARTNLAPLVDNPGIRWTLYETTLFGDPAVAIKSVNCVAVSFPDGLPEMIPPNTGITFNVLATGIGEGVPASGTGQLHCSIDGGDPEIVSMVEMEPNLYEATLPPVACGSSIEFYASVENGSGEKYYSPDPASPIELSPISDSIILFEDDFETDKGWIISGGLWERGIPTGQGGTEQDYPVPDPTEGCNGVNVIGYNLDGDYENSLPETYIISPVIDCSGMDNVFLKFCRWLGVEAPVYDKARILASNDGSSWTLVWENYATIADLDWETVEYDISSVAANQPVVYVAWTMGPTDGGLRYIGWNIDDMRVLSYGCESVLYGDANGDNDINVADAVHIINYVFKGGPAPEPIEAGDANCDGPVNVADAVFLINYVFKGGPVPGC